MRIRERLTYANVAATLALVLAVAGLGGGVAYAHGKVGPKDIKKDAVKSKHIKKGKVKSSDIKNNNIKSKDIKDGEVTGADIMNGQVTGADVKDGSIGLGDLASDARPTLPTAHAAEAITEHVHLPPDADTEVLSLDLPAGRWFLIATGEGGALGNVGCRLEEYVADFDTWSPLSYSSFDSQFSSVAFSAVADFGTPTPARVSCWNQDESAHAYIKLNMNAVEVQ